MKVGDKVFVLKNDEDGEFRGGEIGTVLKIHEDEDGDITVQLPDMVNVWPYRKYILKKQGLEEAYPPPMLKIVTPRRFRFSKEEVRNIADLGRPRPDDVCPSQGIIR